MSSEPRPTFSSLTDEDVTGGNKLAVAFFKTETLGLGITSVLGGTDALFMSEKLNIYIKHCFFLLLKLICKGENFRDIAALCRQAEIREQ